MKWTEIFQSWGLNSVKLNLKFAELDFKPNADDKIAAWEMYVELITRIDTQRLKLSEGDEKAALESIHSLFDTTRDILKEYGRKCREFTRLSIIVLNQIIRPFTSKWHKLSLNDAFSDPGQCASFRQELELLQDNLRSYTGMLAKLAEVEDLSYINWA